MPRPPKEKRIHCHPGRRVFRPAGIPFRKAEAVQLSLEEFEAIRLVDVEGLHHGTAAEKMGTSRPTLTRILHSARRKAGEALVGFRPLVVEGGNVTLDEMPEFSCRRCDLVFRGSSGADASWNCPKCGKFGDYLERESPNPGRDKS